jgi:hypothetical protein
LAKSSLGGRDLIFPKHHLIGGTFERKFIEGGVRANSVLDHQSVGRNSSMNSLNNDENTNYLPILSKPSEE